jgi:predicted ribosome quality control (RQC) complex YloA/Tae2 family protein
MSGEPRAPPPAGPRVQALEKELKELREAYANLQKEHSIMQDKCEARLNECGELLATNATLLKEKIKLVKQLALAHNALTAANIPLPPEPDEDPEAAEGGTRRRHRRRRKRTSRT